MEHTVWIVATSSSSGLDASEHVAVVLQARERALRYGSLEIRQIKAVGFVQQQQQQHGGNQQEYWMISMQQYILACEGAANKAAVTSTVNTTQRYMMKQEQQRIQRM
jgi:hypothetical protein